MKHFYFLILFLTVQYSFSQYGNVSTIAGGGTNGHDVIGGLATDADLSYPTGIAIDNAGNIYFSEITNSIIRKIDVNGIISDIIEFPEVNTPHGLTVDASGTIFFIDRANDRVRKLDTNGTITTVAGNGTNGDSGDGGPATSAQLNTPQYVAVDASGNIYISDWQNHKIKKVTTDGIINTIAGTGVYGFSGDGGLATQAELKSPSGITVDTSGNIYFSDRNNYRVRKIDTNGIITTIAGKGGFQPFSGDGGLAIDAELYEPSGITIDNSGNIYVVDGNNQRVRKITTDGIINTIIGSGATGINSGGFNGDGLVGTATLLNQPVDVVIDNSGNVIVGDYKNHRIRKLPSAALSVDNFSLENIKLYPNPISIDEQLTISSQEIITAISVYNTLGQEVYQAKPNANNYVINLNKITSGIYLVKLNNTENKSINYRLIKK
ncbi:T9SS type A sorting domain-containing protein [Aureibaculum sp. A20]|uniref:T9SS type A sorting domain-containing protein n=1 Tax=Aureibaculum flavum TaxID=2795986 RepID=A0ABS0WSB8_9FLAO|nr:T9SS type A sorting domain-containing protein [Aureibaculum flavum]MBJ2174879.1 T9SS type A sorting domain-containing protein [Aureibaculum flavum]